MAFLVRSDYIPFSLDRIHFVDSVPSSLAYFQSYWLWAEPSTPGTLLKSGLEHTVAAPKTSAFLALLISVITSSACAFSQGRGRASFGWSYWICEARFPSIRQDFLSFFGHSLAELR